MATPDAPLGPLEAEMDDSIWKEQAERAIAIHGVAKARLITRQARDNNSPGTASFSFHNAVLKQIERVAGSAA